jgi:hypothetical protein
MIRFGEDVCGKLEALQASSRSGKRRTDLVLLRFLLELGCGFMTGGLRATDQ